MTAAGETFCGSGALGASSFAAVLWWAGDVSSQGAFFLSVDGPRSAKKSTATATSAAPPA